MVESGDVLATISLSDSATPENLAKLVLDACSESGFFYLTDHGVSDNDIDAMFRLSQGFFAMEEAEKLKYRREGNVGNIVSYYNLGIFAVEIR
jgi:isopenicillin N synthase-like dioxygenase